MDDLKVNQDNEDVKQNANWENPENAENHEQIHAVETPELTPLQDNTLEQPPAQDDDKIPAIEEIKDQTLTPSQNEAQPTTPPPSPTTKKSSSLLKTILIILAIIGVSLGIAALVYWQFYYKPNQQNLPIQPEPTSAPTSTPSEQGPTASSSADIISANNQFALEYYSQIKDKEDGNIFYSPFSISSALAMTYEGARGQTAEEMAAVFHFPKDLQTLRNEYQSIYSEVNKADKAYELKTANALWAQKDYPFLTDYLSTVEKYYAGKVTNLDFVSDTENSRTTINNWVEDQTNDKIKDLIPQGVLNSLTRLVLTNAIYFKGEWVTQFNEEETQENYPFRNGNETIEVEMMQRTDDESEFKYAENDQLQILEMPYSGKELSMLILLPKNDNLATLEDSLNTDNLNNWRQSLKNQRVDIYIPKFNFETKYMMADDLTAMGMPMAFGSEADFSGMDGAHDLFIESVIHQAFVEVNEEGTEAAAATAVVIAFRAMIDEAPTIPVFLADHPFIFIIQDNATGNILFIGRVTNPNQNS